MRQASAIIDLRTNDHFHPSPLYLIEEEKAALLHYDEIYIFGKGGNQRKNASEERTNERIIKKREEKLIDFGALEFVPDVRT